VFGIQDPDGTFVMGPGERNPDGLTHGSVSFVARPPRTSALKISRALLRSPATGTSTMPSSRSAAFHRPRRPRWPILPRPTPPNPPVSRCSSSGP
jgi:hypothetical protein